MIRRIARGVVSARSGFRGVRGFAIDIKQVARMASCKVHSEDDAKTIDDLIIGKGLAKLKELKGFAGIERYFCKEHYDYRLIVTFEGLENFKAYMDSHEKELEDKFVEASKLSTTSVMEFQNFVSSKYGSRGGGTAFDCLSDDFTAY
mmetsp:Transcript_18617/g.27859  ORF Transcript_18617/g.27859 Transcript_18617/m.27859 type:complete len:147 (-) Transcript_18617:189-629(-)